MAGKSLDPARDLHMCALGLVFDMETWLTCPPQWKFRLTKATIDLVSVVSDITMTFTLKTEQKGDSLVWVLIREEDQFNYI